MAHMHSPEADALLDREFKVLDHGFVLLVDYLGTDKRIVDSARVSYAGGTKIVRRDEDLIDHLMRNHHTSPFEQVVFTFHVKMPIFVARQWVRHRTARMNEISGRYSVMKEEFYVPSADHVHFQSKTNRQGRDESVPAPATVAKKIRKEFDVSNKSSYERYKEMIDQGITREISRINLPLSLYTEFYWQMDLHNLLHFLHLRMDKHAQLEIRLYAQVMADIVKTVVPQAWSAFERYVLNARSLAPEELEDLRRMIEGEEPKLSGQRLIDLKEKIGLKPLKD
jgi:thymidylate synthase (FAD)